MDVCTHIYRPYAGGNLCARVSFSFFLACASHPLVSQSLRWGPHAYRTHRTRIRMENISQNLPRIIARNTHSINIRDMNEREAKEMRREWQAERESETGGGDGEAKDWHTDRQTDRRGAHERANGQGRQTDRQTDGQTDGQSIKCAIHVCMYVCRERSVCTDTQQTDGQTTCRQSGRQTDRQTVRGARNEMQALWVATQVDVRHLTYNSYI